MVFRTNDNLSRETFLLSVLSVRCVSAAESDGAVFIHIAVSFVSPVARRSRVRVLLEYTRRSHSFQRSSAVWRFRSDFAKGFAGE